MKLTWAIQLCKNVFAMKNGIIALTFHEQDLKKVVVEVWTGPSLARGLYPAKPAIFPTDRIGPANERRFFQRAGLGRAGNREMIFPTGRARPANERWFFQRAGPGRQKRNEFGPCRSRAWKYRPVQASRLSVKYISTHKLVSIDEEWKLSFHSVRCKFYKVILYLFYVIHYFMLRFILRIYYVYI